MEQLRDEIKSIGSDWLVDESVVVNLGDGRIVEVAGVNFHWKQAKEKFLSAIDGFEPSTDAGFRIIMAHDPRLFAWLPAGRFDLMLSGHTHGGQIGTNMFGLAWSVLRPLASLIKAYFNKMDITCMFTVAIGIQAFHHVSVLLPNSVV